MKHHRNRSRPGSTNWQGGLVLFGVTGALGLAMYATMANKSGSRPVMIAPPGDFNPQQAQMITETNSAPTSTYVYSGSGNGSYLSVHGYYRVYGYPGYYYKPAPGSTVEFVEGGSAKYQASSPGEAEDVVRGGFGEGGEGEGGESSGHGGGEGGGHGGGE